MDQIIIVPQPSAGLVITVNFNGFVVGAGVTAQLVLSINDPAFPRVPVYLTLILAEDGLSGTYSMNGSEFTNAGWYDAQLKVTGTQIALYSTQAIKAVLVQGVLG